MVGVNWYPQQTHLLRKCVFWGFMTMFNAGSPTIAQNHDNKININRWKRLKVIIARIPLFLSHKVMVGVNWYPQKTHLLRKFEFWGFMTMLNAGSPTIAQNHDNEKNINRWKESKLSLQNFLYFCPIKWWWVWTDLPNKHTYYANLYFEVLWLCLTLEAQISLKTMIIK